MKRLLMLFSAYRDVVSQLELERAAHFSANRENDRLRKDLDATRTRLEDDLRRSNDFLGLTGWNLSIHNLVTLPPREEQPDGEEQPVSKRFAGNVAREADAQFEREYDAMIRLKYAKQSEAAE